MAQITVTRQADGTFRVQTPAGTSHQASVPAGFRASLGCGHVEPGELVRASFEFLLEREPATSILHEFSLDLISRLSAHLLLQRLANLAVRAGSGCPP